MKKNPRVGDVVSVIFEDHSEGDSVPTFQIWGVVTAKDRTKLTVATWIRSDHQHDGNEVTYSILRKAIKECYIMAGITEL